MPTPHDQGQVELEMILIAEVLAHLGLNLQGQRIVEEMLRCPIDGHRRQVSILVFKGGRDRGGKSRSVGD
jgi:hypothetical protein